MVPTSSETLENGKVTLRPKTRLASIKQTAATSEKRKNSVVPSETKNKMKHEISVLGEDSAELESLLNCPICMDRFCNPKVLPCQHTFCLSCLTQHYETSYRQRLAAYQQMICPTCRAKSTIPRDGIGGFQNDFRVLQIKDFLSKLEVGRGMEEAEEFTAHQCEVCKFGHEAREASSYCLQCQKHLCSICSRQHEENTLFRQHSLIVTDGDEVEALKCQEHREDIKFYCLQCKQVLCTICVLSLHGKHEVKDLDNAGMQQREDIRRLLDRLRQTLGLHQDKFARIELLREDHRKQISLQRELIAKRVDSIVEILRAAKLKLLSELSAEEKKIEKLLSAEADSADVVIGRMESLAIYAEGMCEPEHSLQLMATFPHLLDRLESVSSTLCEELPDSFRKSLKFEMDRIPDLGKLKKCQLQKCGTQVVDTAQVANLQKRRRSMAGQHATSSASSTAPVCGASASSCTVINESEDCVDNLPRKEGSSPRSPSKKFVNNLVMVPSRGIFITRRKSQIHQAANYEA